jgi:DNA-binding CsgD family transcriptional regulator
MKTAKGILAQLPTYIFWKNTQAEYLGCNPRFALFAGLKNPRAIIGKTDWDFRWHPYANLYRENDQTILTHLTGGSYFEPIIGVQGNPMNIYVNKAPLYDKIGQVYGVISCFTEMTAIHIQQYNDLQIQQHNALTKRESEIMKHLLNGKTSRKIAEILQISFRTVENYIAHIKIKMNVSSKSELIDKILQGA